MQLAQGRFFYRDARAFDFGQHAMKKPMFQLAQRIGILDWTGEVEKEWGQK